METGLDAINGDIKNIIAKNPDVPDTVKNSVKPGTISKCIY